MNKFSQLVSQGVASFEYTPIAHDVPNTCPICRTYNNVYSLVNDTHMSVLDDGRYVITGHAIANRCMFDQFLCSNVWGWVDFKDSGLGSPAYFFVTRGLKGHYDTLNGDNVYILDQIRPGDETETADCDTCCCPNCVTICGTSIPEHLEVLTTDGDRSHIQECFKQKNLIDVAKMLNEDSHILGNNWICVGLSTGDRLVSVGTNKTYIL